MEEIKNCPFCDRKPVGPEPADSDWWIECEHCEIIMSNDSKAELIRRWNRLNPGDGEQIYQKAPGLRSGGSHRCNRWALSLLYTETE